MEIKLKSPDDRIEMLSIFRKIKDDRSMRYFIKKGYKHRFRKNFGRGNTLHRFSEHDEFNPGLYFMQRRVKRLHYSSTRNKRYNTTLSYFINNDQEK